MGKTYKDMKNAPKWERIKKRDFEEDNDEPSDANRSPKPERKNPRGYRNPYGN